MKVMAYPMKDVFVQEIIMPCGARVLGVSDVYGVPTLYALASQDHLLTEPRRFHRVRTGFPAPEGVSVMKYIGSFLVMSFGDTFHVFEESIAADEIVYGGVETDIVSLNGNVEAEKPV
jgi:hypothetical protein